MMLFYAVQYSIGSSSVRCAVSALSLIRLTGRPRLLSRFPPGRYENQAHDLYVQLGHRRRDVQRLGLALSRLKTRMTGQKIPLLEGADPEPPHPGMDRENRSRPSARTCPVPVAVQRLALYDPLRPPAGDARYLDGIQQPFFYHDRRADRKKTSEPFPRAYIRI